jgi:hypothetical protein
LVQRERPVRVPSILDKYYMKIAGYHRNNGGASPASIAVTPSEYHDILVAIQGYESILMSNEAGAYTLFGHAIIMVPFTEDPLFKQFSVMAKLVGAEIDYKVDATGRAADHAEFSKDGAGWIYYSATTTLESSIHPLSEA